MAYDEVLAHRVRALIGQERGLSELSMFGGLAFLLDGNMSVAVSSKGGMMVRIDPDEREQVLALAHVRPMVMGGRETGGWVRVGEGGLGTQRRLAAWVRRGVSCARALPPKG